jgi:phage gp36-like protein
MAYATPADLLMRKDARTIGQLVADDDTQEDSTELQTDANALQALQDASDMVDAACLMAGRYQPSDLSGMTGSGSSLLKRIVCDLAATYLRRRRSYEGDEWPEYQEAIDILERLRKGELIFGSVQAVIDDAQVIVDPLNAIIQSQQNLPSSVAWPFFPSRRYPQ